MSTQKDSSATALSFYTMDSSGKLMIKAQMGDDIRMLPLFNEDITYDELILMMQRVFKGKLSNMDDVTLKYKDEDGDLITIGDTSDLNLATQRNRLLKITIFVKGREVLPLVDASVVKDVRRELTVIRDKVNSLLDALDITDKVPSKSVPDQQQYQSSTAMQQLQTEVGQQAPLVSKAVTSYFDPLKPQTPVSETPTAATAASQTSSSYSSPASSIVGAPPTHQQQQQQQQPTANSSSSTSHLFGHQSQGSVPFLPQQQQQQQQSAAYSQQQQQQPQTDTSYQMPSVYGAQTGYSATSNAPPSTASYPPQQQQQQYQATPTAAGATAYSQGYATSRYPSSATPPQPAAPVSSQAYSIYGQNKGVPGYGQQAYQPYQY